jgi:zinc transport system ATP-binding protein
MTETTLRVRRPETGEVLFETGGKWLHPLFELEDFLRGRDMDVGNLVLEDKIIGLGAAALIARMGFRRCRAGLLSDRAVPLLERYGISYEWDRRVERLGCMTEEIISVGASLDAIHAELSRRAGRAEVQARG